MVKLGSRGSEVRALQHVLGLGIDGIFGQMTRDKVIDYQEKNGLVGDGIVGAKTWLLLNKQLKDLEAVPANRAVFFQEIRPLFGKLSQTQVDGLNTLLDVLENSRVGVNHAAYMLATAYHETAHTMQPIEEYGRGKGRDYGKKLKMTRVPYTVPDELYYGRGYVQLTWYENYEKAGEKLGIDLLNRPDLALDATNAAGIMIYGMSEGWFTGKKLSDYIGSYTADYLDARRIINGMDKAAQIADYAIKFEMALRKSKHH